MGWSHNQRKGWWGGFGNDLVDIVRTPFNWNTQDVHPEWTGEKAITLQGCVRDPSLKYNQMAGKKPGAPINNTLSIRSKLEFSHIQPFFPNRDLNVVCSPYTP
ncbi:hypothetical protein EUGRSUZ_G02975 [Eucalyptus grandis]|uniref:Uncharacterized protein n=2 Tax=Eucalyptus grandis TaxID=71139 RepID=A0ACC3K876_EUCGR|nr:hypothetical protein EUGRSUZ_G02975 [Eucalyptus grandis]